MNVDGDDFHKSRKRDDARGREGERQERIDDGPTIVREGREPFIGFKRILWLQDGGFCSCYIM